MSTDFIPEVADLEQRRRSLDPARSFIVQAPAGSGKTELLIQRYLMLLARVQHPEEIAAITFTRKAAAEMKKRVLEALASARSEKRPAEPHLALTWEHARGALERDAQLDWRLEENAARLRIQTIDALCASLTRQMPVLAAFGAQPQSVEDAGPHYHEAARATLALLQERGAGEQGVADDLAKLLAHLDNNVGVAEDLIAGMLQRRDHWLRNLSGAHDRASLEAALAAVRREAMTSVRELLLPSSTRRGAAEGGGVVTADPNHPGGCAATPPFQGGEPEEIPSSPRRGARSVAEGGVVTADANHPGGCAATPPFQGGELEEIPSSPRRGARSEAEGGVVRELLALATYAAENLAADGRESPIRECADLAALPGTAESDLYVWLGLAELLLTAAGDWRKAANVNLGFPLGTDKAGKTIAKDWKERHAALIERFAESEALRAALEELRRLPPARYTDAQWEALGAIARLLPLAVAQLKVVFAARSEADFVEIAQGALAALGEPEAPTDLLLALDYRIHHILVDEFQDTSFTQFDLLQKLTAGWQQDDGRSLFLVGDPMQSIYRFREAEVGLFLKARNHGIGQVALEPLTLSANFRSQAGIVDWVNRAFARVMPQAENVAAGAVPYSPSEPVHPAESGAVRVHAFFNGDAKAEAEQVAALVQAAQALEPEGSVAVLVRNRSHLEDIVPRLKAKGLSYRAIEIEALGHRQVVQDLLALTRALAHPADRIAWLAVLRAPWCGLTLADLHSLTNEGTPSPGQGKVPAQPAEGVPLNAIQQQLFEESHSRRGEAGNSGISTGTRTLWERVHDEARLAGLTADGRARAERVRDVLAHAMANRLRGSLRDRVESVWLALGGPACVANDTDLEDAEIYLDHLEESEEAGEIDDLGGFEQGLAKLWALPDLAADPKTAVQIMTIHKAKGLEFDTVILPGLGRVPRQRDPSLFLWTETPLLAEDGSARMGTAGLTPLLSEEGSARMGTAGLTPLLSEEGWPRSGRGGALLLAPIKPTGADADRTYDYLVRLDAEKESHEDGRLLYVAATRAKRHLHLLGDTRLATDEDIDLRPPSARSLLAKLWPAVQSDFANAARQSPVSATPLLPEEGWPRSGRGGSEINQDLRRLPSDWIFPAAPPSVSWSAPQDTERSQDDIEFSWVGETARHVGSVVHRWLQRIAEDEMRGWSRARVEKMRDAFRDGLAAHGVEEKELPAAVERVARALANSLEDPRGKWLLGPQMEARNEYRLTSFGEGERRNLVIDRTFKDWDGKRWVVDYKTSGHEGTGLDAFLDRERARYAAQLERYARALGEEVQAKLGLYFPLVSGWRDW